MDNNKLTSKFLELIKIDVSHVNFKTFFSNSHLESIDENKVIISVPTAFAKATLTEKHLPLMEQTLQNILGRQISIEITVKPYTPKPSEDEEDFFQPAQTSTSYLNPKYRLENFVVGPSNNVAYAAAQAVVQNPGISYNPLFIYGGTGVGKTHLMLAIGNEILKTKTFLKIIYCPSETFMNDYVGAIQNHKMADLRNKYRFTQMLLIDDIQFFSGREGTQEEFFHTFNELQSKNSQMVITSDRPPHQIDKLEDRLRSRFAGGLMVDMQKPDFDTRVAILKAKSDEWRSVVPLDALKLIASSTESSIRELEGKLMQILQTLKARNLESTSENIASFLNNTPQKKLSTNYQEVLMAICKYFNLTNKDLMGPKRQKELVLPRHITMYILAEELGMTVEKIGQVLGGRDHTTVMHGRDKMKQLISSDQEIQRIFIEVKQSLSTN